MNIFPPAIQYRIQQPMFDLEIETFTGRIFLTKIRNQKINFTIILTDFGLNRRLETKRNFIFHIKSNEIFPISTLVFGTLISFILILFSILLFILICYCRRPSKSLKTRQTKWTNVSPNTPDTRLIDHEYVKFFNAKKRERKMFIFFCLDNFDRNAR